MIRHSTEDGKIRLEILAQRHNTRHITTSVAVIWRRPNRHNVLVLEMVLVALVDELMCASNELETIDVVELRLLVYKTKNK